MMCGFVVLQVLQEIGLLDEKKDGGRLHGFVQVFGQVHVKD